MDIISQSLNSFYICHHCISYKSRKKNDMKRHLEKINKCNSKSNISYDEAVKLSLLRKYIFDFDISKLETNDYLFIIKNYHKDINYIHFDFYNISNQNHLDILNDKSNLINYQENNINTRKKKDIFYYKYFNEEKNKYVCNECLSEYLSKQSLQIHLTNKKQCEEKKKILEFKKEQLKNYYEEIQNKSETIKTNIENNIKELNKNDSIEICKSDKYDYNTFTYIDVEEYNYMLQRASDIGKNIVKIGMSRDKHGDVRRISKYEKGYKILMIKVVKNAVKTEEELIKYFRSKFKTRPDIGKEYFEGNIKDMEIAFFKITCEN